MDLMWQIVIRTPVWVWGLLAVLLWLGWRDLRDRVITPAQLAILPGVAASISLVNVLTSAGLAIALPAWLMALALAAPLGALIGSRRHLDVQRRPNRLVLAGSWFAMALGLTVFCLRYAMAVAVARHPGLAADAAWIAAASAVGGAVSGIGIGWLASLLARYRHALRGGDAAPANAVAL